MISPGAGPSVEVEVAATLKCWGARARVLSTQEFAAAPQPDLCGLRSSCGRRACAGKAGPRLCTRQEPSPPAEDLARSAGVATAGTRTCGDPSARDDAGPRA